MRRALVYAVVGVCLLVNFSWAGPPNRAGSGAAYQRIICVVPLIGAGTLDDPKRPLFTPVAGRTSTDPELSSLPVSKGFKEPPAIVAYQSLVSDDGQSAIVEYVARDRATFGPLLTNNSIKIFDRQTTKAADLIRELRKFKKDFNLRQLKAGTL